MIIRRTLQLSALALPLSVAHADWTPPHAPVEVPLDRFHALDGLEVTLWASSPQLFNPTNMDIDAAGRIWVTEGVNYRGHQDRRPQGDRVVVLQDLDGDGRADESHTFVQEPGLVAPLGIAVFDNRVIVSQPPDLIQYTDVDRDLRFDPAVDKREVLLTGFNAINHDHSLHSVTGGPDGKWYFNNGNCGALFTDQSDRTFRIGSDYYRDGGGEWPIDTRAVAGQESDDGHVWVGGFSARMNPDGSEVEIIGHGYRNSYEHCMNSFGELFQNDNDDPPACRTSYVLEYGSAGYFTPDGAFYRTVKRPGQEHWRNHWRQDDPGTFESGDVYGGGSPTGIVFYENGALGEEHVGMLLSCEAGRNVIFHYHPKPRGASYRLERHDWLTTNTTGEFDGADFTGGVRRKTVEEDGRVKVDDHLLFRPSDVAVGADGAIYVSDWLDPRVGGHADLDDSCSGAIYRIAPKDFRPQNPAVDLATIEGAVTALRSPAVNVRWTGFDALRRRGEAAYEAVAGVLDDPDPWIAARAVWLLPHLGEPGLAKARELFESGDAMTRMAVFRALLRAGRDVRPLAAILATDETPALRREAALSMRDRPASESAAVLVEVARRWDGEDKNYLEAIGLGAAGHEDEVWKQLRGELGAKDPLKWDDRFAKLTWRLWPVAAIDDLGRRAASLKLSREQRDFAAESLSFIDHPKAADALFALVGDESPSKEAAIRWLFLRGTGPWAKFGLRERLKETGIYDPDAIELTQSIVPGRPASTKFSEEDVLALEGDAKRGAELALRCTMCHHINGMGPHYGPALEGWTSRQGVENTVKAIVHPSAEIAHGYAGTAIQYEDNHWIDGLVIAEGDPVVITSTGGLTQMVPHDRIRQRKHMDRSLMLNADQLGLTPQDVADIVAWLKHYDAPTAE